MMKKHGGSDDDGDDNDDSPQDVHDFGHFSDELEVPFNADDF